ncbi:MAG: DNA recombination protein RmuC [Candidatus Protistobacter heckmanni]|nr:DNA recombination protein RmuC [Candidatus Protistobacter heckmanni]
MNGVTLLLLVAMAAALVLLVLVLLALRRRGGAGDDGQFEAKLAAQLQARFQEAERNLRAEISESARVNRTELGNTLAQWQQTASTQSHQMREELANALRRFNEATNQQLAELRSAVELRLKEIETRNAAKLEEIRHTVDEKLHATLEQRLGESFKQVSDRLEQVHRGLGEMQSLAQGVGDLKRVLTNVKTRGTWGEVQLDMLLDQLLTADQYARNVETVRGSGARVEFAIKLPGRGGDLVSEAPVWLPIDAKFPREQYERLVDAQERGDAEGVLAAGKELETAVRKEAQTIAGKYLAPPATTDFALLFLPTEGLYAEVIRRPGLCDQLQREHRITVAGPTTLTALLNSLQMGFRTLALEKRSSEVWEVLGAVKTEFAKFGDVLAKTKDTLVRAAKNIEDAETRSRQMARKLRSVEALPGETAQNLLGLDARPGTDSTEE